MLAKLKLPSCKRHDDGIDRDGVAGLYVYLAHGHIAFGAQDYDGVLERIRKHGVPVRENNNPGNIVRQLFLFDPNGVGALSPGSRQRTLGQRTSKMSC